MSPTGFPFSLVSVPLLTGNYLRSVYWQGGTLSKSGFIGGGRLRGKTLSKPLFYFNSLERVSVPVMTGSI